MWTKYPYDKLSHHQTFTPATTPSVASFVVMWRFRLFLGQCTNYPCAELSPSLYQPSLYRVVPISTILVQSCPHINQPCTELSSYQPSLYIVVPISTILVQSCPHMNHPCAELFPYEPCLCWVVPLWTILFLSCPHMNHPCAELLPYEPSLCWVVPESLLQKVTIMLSLATCNAVV